MSRKKIPISSAEFRRRLSFVAQVTDEGLGGLCKRTGVRRERLLETLHTGRLPSDAKIAALLRPAGVPLALFLGTEPALVAWLQTTYPSRFPSMESLCATTLRSPPPSR